LKQKKPISGARMLNERSFSRIFEKYMPAGFIIVSADRSCQAENFGEPCDDQQELRQRQINNKNRERIKNEIKRAGFSYIPVSGGYQEELKDEDGNVVIDPETNKPKMANQEPERAFMVLPFVKNRVGDSDLEQFVATNGSGHPNSSGTSMDMKLFTLGIRLAKMFNQDTFLQKHSGNQRNAYLFDKNGALDMDLTDYNISDMAQIYFTQLTNHVRLKPYKGDKFGGANPGEKKRFSYLAENKKRVFWISHPPRSASEAYGRRGEIFL